MKKSIKYHLFLLIPFVLLLLGSFISVIPQQGLVVTVPLDTGRANYLRSSSSLIVDTYYYDQWGLFAVKADVAHGLGMTGKNKSNPTESIIVAILDTGVDFNHLDLKNNMVGMRNFLGLGGPPWNNASYAMDLNGHGTHVTGIVCAEDNTIGVRGVAPDAKFWAMKVMNDIGINKDDPIGDPADMAAAITWIVNNAPPSNATHGVDIISMSLGSEGYDAGVEAAIQNAVGAGIIVVAAAGNNQTTPSPMLYPAALENVYAVGAVTILNHLTSYSQYTTPAAIRGPGDQIDFVAPGGGAYDPEAYRIFSTYPIAEGSYEYAIGTSMATPFVTGVMAVLLGQEVATNDTMNQTLISKAKDLGAAGYDYMYGNGLVQILSATELPLDLTIFVLTGGIVATILLGVVFVIIAIVRRKK